MVCPTPHHLGRGGESRQDGGQNVRQERAEEIRTKRGTRERGRQRGSSRQQDASERRQDGRQPRALPLCWLIGGEVVAITSPRAGWPPIPSTGCDWVMGKPLAMVRTVRQQTERKRGEELARMSAASFALFLSVFRFFFFPFVFVLSIYNKVYIII